MAEVDNVSKAKQIRALLYVLGSGVVAAIVLAFSMLYYYNPSGSYLAKNVLIEPGTALSMRFSESNTQKGGGPHFIFDRFEFTCFDPATKRMKTTQIDLGKYANFYALVAEDESLVEVPELLIAPFYGPRTATLALKVHDESNNRITNNSKTFSEVDFSPESDYYRIQLHEQGAAQTWAYFYHPGIYAEILKLYCPRPEIEVLTAGSILGPSP